MISKHISYKEATFSNTAVRKGIDNTPNADQLANMKLLAEMVFEPLRIWYGKPIKISSFFRSKALNKAVGGSFTSQHVTGQAIDIDRDLDNKRLFDYICTKLKFTQLIWEFGNDENPDWIHISYDKNNLKGEILRAIKNGQKTHYIRL